MATKKNVRKKLKEFKEKISLPILKQPPAIKKMKTKNIIFFLVTCFILDMMSFCLQGVNMALDAGLIWIAVFLLVLHFSERIIESMFATYRDLNNDLFSQLYSAESSQMVMNLSNSCRNKVLKDEHGVQTVMETAEMIQKSRWYIDSVWRFWWNIPGTISQTLTLVIMIMTTIMIELTSNPTSQLIFTMSLLIVCVGVYFWLGKKRIDLLDNYRKTRRELQSKEDVLLTEVKSIEYMSKRDFEYHANRLRDNIVDSRDVVKTENLKLNKVFIQRAFISSGFMVAILLFKIFTAEEINASVLLNVVAISTVYSGILSKISTVISSFESIADLVIDVNTLYPDFKNIYDTYVEETCKEITGEQVDSITVNSFSVSQDPKKVYELKNESPFYLERGDFVLVQGPTGCGKSTLLLLLTGKLQLKGNPIWFSTGKNGYLKSIAYQTDKSMANNFIMSEIILSDDYETADKPKLFEILHGVCLYDELLKMAKINEGTKNLPSDDEKVFEFMKIRKYEQFSSGQKQRLAIAKLLYTMSNEHQIIAFDEVLNRLDDETVKRIVPFVAEYVQRDMKRIILLATHQVELVRKYCNKEIYFSQDLSTAYLHTKSL